MFIHYVFPRKHYEPNTSIPFVPIFSYISENWKSKSGNIVCQRQHKQKKQDRAVAILTHATLPGLSQIDHVGYCQNPVRFTRLPTRSQRYTFRVATAGNVRTVHLNCIPTPIAIYRPLRRDAIFYRHRISDNIERTVECFAFLKQPLRLDCVDFQDDDTVYSFPSVASLVNLNRVRRIKMTIFLFAKKLKTT